MVGSLSTTHLFPPPNPGVLFLPATGSFSSASTLASVDSYTPIGQKPPPEILLPGRRLPYRYMKTKAAIGDRPSLESVVVPAVSEGAKVFLDPQIDRIETMRVDSKKAILQGIRSGSLKIVDAAAWREFVEVAEGQKWRQGFKFVLVGERGLFVGLVARETDGGKKEENSHRHVGQDADTGDVSAAGYFVVGHHGEMVIGAGRSTSYPDAEFGSAAIPPLEEFFENIVTIRDMEDSADRSIRILHDALAVSLLKDLAPPR